MILKSEADTFAIAEKLGPLCRSGDVLTFSGPLGVGKTTLVRGLMRSLGYPGEVPSPSFAIVQPYEVLDPPVWHVDLYRLEDRSELAELGLHEHEGILLVEWPERAGAGAWPDALRLSLEFAEDGARRLTVIVPPAWEDRWPPR